MNVGQLHFITATQVLLLNSLLAPRIGLRLWNSDDKKIFTPCREPETGSAMRFDVTANVS